MQFCYIVKKIGLGGVNLLQQINEHLVHIKGAMRKKKKWEIQLEDYEAELENIEKSITQLEAQLKDEKADVKKLTGMSFSNLLHTLLGKKDEKLMKEEQEVIAVQLKLDEAIKSKNEIVNSINRLKSQIEKLSDIEGEYKRTLDLKVDVIKQKDESFAEELYQLSELEGDLEQYLIEVDEAIAAGQVAKNALEGAMEQLDSASNWGLFDMFGGGVVSTAIKHSHIDKATKSIQHAQSKIRLFQKELLDINEDNHLEINISGFLTFADYFFDNLLTDWMVQNRIHESKENVQQVYENISDILAKLKEEKQVKTDEYEQTKKRRKTFIETF